MKKLFTLIIICISFITLTACGKTTVNNSNTVKKTADYGLIDPTKLVVAMSTDYAPYEFVDLTKTGQDKYVGSDVALAKEFAKYLGVELVIKAMDFDSTLVAVDNGIADIGISGFSYTASRASSYLYTDCYFGEGDGGQVIVIKKEDNTKYTTLESMNNADVKVAGQNGSLQQDLVTNQLPNATLVKIDDLNSAYDSLDAGSLDGIAIAKNVADALVAKFPEKYVIMAQTFDFEDDGSYGIVKSGNTKLADAFNDCISKFADNQYQTWIDTYQDLFANLGDNAGELIPEEE